MSIRSVFFLSICFLATWLTACDDGRIYESKTVVATASGSTVKLTASFTGVSSWPSAYTVALAGFGESSYAKTVKTINKSNSDVGEVSIVLSNISGDDVSTMEICVVNNLRKRIVSFYETDFVESEDTIYINAGAVDVTMFAAIQENVFNNHCVACHGNSNFAAANLYLTEGKSYDALVNVASQRSADGLLLVAPSDASNSFLIDVLQESDVIGHDHTDILSARTDLITMIQNWINAGAKE